MLKKQKQNTLQWDVEKYKTDHESEEHWNLRKHFIMLHKDRFPEDQLICLAQVFINVEFMGCKYPPETMQLVAELSKEVATEFRESRSNRLKRTFVLASDAAEARVKVPATKPFNNHFKNEADSKNITQMNKLKFSDMQKNEQKRINVNFFDGLKFKNFVRYLGTHTWLRVSAKKCGMKITEREYPVEGGYKIKFELLLDNILVASATDINFKLARAKAMERVIDVLQRHCYSIKINAKADSIKITKSNNEVKCDVEKHEEPSLKDKKLDSSNLGYKMLQSMGWQGGGLGSEEQGRENPVGYLKKNNRAGIGNKVSSANKAYFQNILREYISSRDIRDLNFDATFAREERGLLHKMAAQMGLRHTSQGIKDDRKLTIQQKNITTQQILTEVLLNKNPIFCNKYLVQVPQSKANQFPEFTTKLEM